MTYIEIQARNEIADIDSQLKFFECYGGRVMSKKSSDYEWKDNTEERIAELKSEREELINYIN